MCKYLRGGVTKGVGRPRGRFYCFRLVVNTSTKLVTLEHGAFNRIELTTVISIPLCQSSNPLFMYPKY